MTWTQAAIDAAAQLKHDQLELRIASGVKWCPRHNDGTGKSLPIENFGPARNRPDGRHGWCTSCVRAGKAAERDRAVQAAIAAAQAEAEAAAAAEEAARAAVAAERAEARARAQQAAAAAAAALAAGLTPETRVAEIRARVEAERARERAAAAWRRGTGPALPDMHVPSPVHPLGWSRAGGP